MKVWGPLSKASQESSLYDLPLGIFILKKLSGKIYLEYRTRGSQCSQHALDVLEPVDVEGLFGIDAVVSEAFQ